MTYPCSFGRPRKNWGLSSVQCIPTTSMNLFNLIWSAPANACAINNILLFSADANKKLNLQQKCAAPCLCYLTPNLAPGDFKALKDLAFLNWHCNACALICSHFSGPDRASVVCESLYVYLHADNNFWNRWPLNLARWFIVTPSRWNSKLEVIGLN